MPPTANPLRDMLHNIGSKSKSNPDQEEAAETAGLNTFKIQYPRTPLRTLENKGPSVRTYITKFYHRSGAGKIYPFADTKVQAFKPLLEHISRVNVYNEQLKTNYFTLVVQVEPPDDVANDGGPYFTVLTPTTEGNLLPSIDFNNGVVIASKAELQNIIQTYNNRLPVDPQLVGQGFVSDRTALSWLPDIFKKADDFYQSKTLELGESAPYIPKNLFTAMHPDEAEKQNLDIIYDAEDGPPEENPPEEDYNKEDPIEDSQANPDANDKQSLVLFTKPLTMATTTAPIPTKTPKRKPTAKLPTAKSAEPGILSSKTTVFEDTPHDLPVNEAIVKSMIGTIYSDAKPLDLHDVVTKADAIRAGQHLAATGKPALTSTGATRAAKPAVTKQAPAPKQPKKAAAVAAPKTPTAPKTAPVAAAPAAAVPKSDNKRKAVSQENPAKRQKKTLITSNNIETCRVFGAGVEKNAKSGDLKLRIKDYSAQSEIMSKTMTGIAWLTYLETMVAAEGEESRNFINMVVLAIEFVCNKETVQELDFGAHFEAAGSYTRGKSSVSRFAALKKLLSFDAVKTIVEDLENPELEITFLMFIIGVATSPEVYHQPFLKLFEMAHVKLGEIEDITAYRVGLQNAKVLTHLHQTWLALEAHYAAECPSATPEAVAEEPEPEPEPEEEEEFSVF